MSITTTSGTVLNGLYVGSSTPVANQKGLLIDNKYFIPLVEGSSSGTDTSDATAVASDIIAGKTAYTVDGKVTGTLPKLTVTYDDTMFIYTAAHDGYLNAGDQVLDFSAATSGTASGAGMLQGDTAWVNGQRIVGEIPIVTASISGNTVTVPYGYHESDSTFTVDSYTGAYTVNPGTSSQTLSTSGKYMTSDIVVSGDSNLLAENIKKGVSIFGIVGTLESGGGSSAEYYKCASVSSGASQPEGYNLTVEFYGFTINEAGTNYDQDSEKTVIRMTMQDTSASGLDRVWVSDDGAWKLMKYEVPTSHISWGLYKTSRGDFEYFVDADCVSNQDAMSAAWENGETYSDDVNPWVLTRIRWSDDPAWTDLAWTVSPAVSGGSTWSGYKATQGDDGKYSFAETATTGLSYDGGFTPQVGTIYSQDAKVKVAQLMEATVAIPQDGLILYMPFNGSSEVKVGTLVSSKGTVTFGEEAGQKYGVFDGSTAFSLKTILGDETTDTCTVICYAKGAFSSGQTGDGYVFWSQTHPSGSNSWGNGVYLAYDGTFCSSNSIKCTRNAWNFFCIRRTSRTDYKIQINSNVYTDMWGNQNLGTGNFIGFGGSGGYWRGNIFDCAVYNRILTDAEVEALYQRVIPLQA